jgi:DNA recombination protein RmuC
MQSHGELATLLRGVGEGLDGLRSETGSLVAALRRPEARGSWGEIQLRRVVELAGMVERCDFVRQETVHTGDGARLRPDVLVRLPGGRVVVVDAKVPLDAYLSAVEASDDADRARHLAAHARQVRAHVTQLASRAYHEAVPGTPEFVVLFLPSDAIFQAALAEDPGLLEHGVDRNVLVATPTTLIALLRAVHHGWRQELLAESAREIADAGRELHRRAGTFLGAFALLGRRLGSATAAYNEAVGSLEARVLPQLRRLEEAGAAAAPVEEPARLDVPPRVLTDREVA